MSTYAMSDNHGKFDEFMSMLELIKFDKTKDKLYVLGDMVDWGKQSVEVMQYCMENQDCITSVIGNHEYMMLDYIKENGFSSHGNYHNWFSNGGKKTLAQINYKITKSMRQRLIISWVKSLPYFAEIEVNSRQFYLCHSYPYIDTGNKEKDEETMIWRRVAGEENPLGLMGIADKILIAGHTPTKYEYYYPEQENEPFRIHQDLKNQKIMIDCGAKMMSNTKLDKGNTARFSCLRLDDLAEFYVKNNI